MEINILVRINLKYILYSLNQIISLQKNIWSYCIYLNYYYKSFFNLKEYYEDEYLVGINLKYFLILFQTFNQNTTFLKN